MPLRFGFLGMGSFGRCTPLTCERCGWRSMVVDETFICEACVLFFGDTIHYIKKIYNDFFSIFLSLILKKPQPAAYPPRTAKQHCDASYGAGGDDCSLNIILFAMLLHQASTLLDASVY